MVSRVKAQPDPLRDFLDRAIAAGESGPVTEARLAAIEQEVRADWSGERCYIAEDPDRTIRRQAAITSLDHGERPQQVAEKTGLSRSQIYRILSERRRR